MPDRMADLTPENGQPTGTPPPPAGTEPAPTTQSPPPPSTPTPKKRPPKAKKPNYALLHAKPLPLEIHPLPAFHPSHPLSLLRLAYAYLSQLLSPPTSHPLRYTGYWSEETRSVHVTDPKHVRALWEMGFFGKGTLSRSEPSWLSREKAKLEQGRGGTAEEATRARRETRRLFKLERARLEALMIERQRAVEEGRLTREEVEALERADVAAEEKMKVDAQTATPVTVPASEDTSQQPLHQLTQTSTTPQPEDVDFSIPDQEHLQLTPQEAFFLSSTLGVLDIHHTPTSHTPASHSPLSPTTLLHLFTTHATFPPISSPTLSPDNPFLLHYVVYHHFRSLGWVVRPGVKFSCDYLLYNRGPVFSHAEFAILILPAYTDPYWQTKQGKQERLGGEQRDWWWLHCVNRVQSQVRKTLVLVYVDVPPPRESGEGDVEVGELLKGYKVREFVIRRWLANRSRD